MKHIFLLLLVYIGLLNCIQAQTDSLQIELEAIDPQNDYFKRRYSYLDINLSDDDNILKLGVQPFKPDESFKFSTIVIHGSVERKLNTTFSFTNEINAVLTWGNTQELNEQYDERSSTHRGGYSFGMRYYPAKKHEVNRNLSGNNCNGVYLEFKFKDFLLYRVSRYEQEEKGAKTDAIVIRNSNFDLTLKPQFGIGYQQRLRSHFYIDTSFFVNYDLTITQELGYGMKFIIGGILSTPD